MGFGHDTALEQVIKPYVNGRDVAQTSRNVMIIDLFGFSKENVLQKFPQLYQWLFENVKPERDQNRNALLRERWWLHRRLREDLRRAFIGVNSFIATVETSKHRFFVTLDKSIMPDNMLVNIAVDDYFLLGVLSSRVHIAWALNMGGSLEDRPRYNKTVCFETFPFPNAGEAQKARIRDLAEQIDAHRKRQQAAHPTLTLTNTYNVLEKLRSGEALNDKEKLIHRQGLVAILREFHDDLDRAVFNAYGWDDLAAQLVGKPGATTPLPDKPDAQTQAEEELLSRLVDLNTQRTAEEAQGHIRWLRPEFQSPELALATLNQREESTADASRSLSEVEGSTAPTDKLNWPKGFPEQIKIVRELLQLAPQTAAGLADRFKRKPVKGVQPVVDALVALGVAVEAGGHYKVVST